MRCLGVWIGPTSFIWTDQQCRNIENVAGFVGNLDECQRACIEKHRCSAIHFNPGVGCTLRDCPSPVPTPSSDYGNYVGYYVSGMY